MSSHETHAMLPESLKRQLSQFRRRLWTIKAIEAAGAAVFAVATAYLALFAIDRLVDAPAWVRALLAVAGLAGCAAVPVYIVRWVWRRRRLDQLARLLSRRHPSVGDQILGVIELVGSESEQARSRTLCEAAIRQVAEDAAGRDFKDAVPTPRHRLWSVLAAAPLAGAALLAFLVPAAAANAWARFLNPFADVERYTFTSVEPIPDRLVVAHGEPFTLSVRLREDSRRRPARAAARLDRQPAVLADAEGGRFEFSMPAQIEPGWLQLRIGDVRKRVRVEPMLRPELVAAAAVVDLPEYLERDKPLEKDVRGGGLTAVRGAVARFSLEANRDLAAAWLDGRPLDVAGAVLSGGPIPIEEDAKLEFTWRDRFGLTGLAPFALALRAADDEPPSISCENLPRQKVLLDSETLNFQIRAVDDFGVKRIGMEWRGIDPSILTASSAGECILAAGGGDREVLEAAGAFRPKSLGIEPQPIHLRLFVEDYLPDRPRVYSSTYVFYVLNPEQHAVWIAEQLNKWHRQSLEVRDRELQLHQANQQLRGLSPEQLDRPETRRQLEAQANAERANARRLDGLVGAGEDLVRQAMRNPEIGVGHLDRWAEMLQVLKDISENRMPSVAELLKQSSQAQGQLASAAGNPSRRRQPSAPQAGNREGQPPGSPTKPGDPEASKSKPPVPSISDQESTQRAPDPDQEPAEPNKSNSQPSLTLPVTTVPGGSSQPPAETLAQEKLDEALVAQQDLLAEFEKIADELNTVLANLEGSTLVKRLKAASRKQQAIAGKIAENIAGSFGRPETSATPDAAKALRLLSEEEIAGSRDVSNIMDDLQAYFERRRFQRFKAVLDEMRDQDAVGSLRQISEDVAVQAGMSLAQTEFWSDAFDRWADNLVDPASSGQCPGSKSKGSLPPSIILEAMQILEEEVNLREQTRVAEQAKPAVGEEEHTAWAGRLDETQTGLAERVAKLSERIQELPDAEADFANEIKLLGAVEEVMHEAADVLGLADTGPRAIAAETEAIELLLQSRKINPRGGGGGGGSNPGGGGGGDATASALALIGAGVNPKESLEDRPVSQATGESGKRYPEEFRAGLDKYFERLERDEASQ